MGNPNQPGRTRPPVAQRVSRQQRTTRSAQRLRDVPQMRRHDDLTAIREKLRGKRGQEYWRSLEELADTPAFQEMLHREFPVGASEWWDEVSRRSFLKFAAASLALAGL